MKYSNLWGYYGVQLLTLPRTLTYVTISLPCIVQFAFYKIMKKFQSVSYVDICISGNLLLSDMRN